MSASVEVVSRSIAVGGATRRSVVERLWIRFPRAFASLIRVGQLLPPRSRLRGALISDALRRGIDALNRGDYAAAFALYHPECELVADGLDTVGAGGTHGREGRIQFQRRWMADWSEFQFLPEEVIALGQDRGLVIGRIRGTGRSSGAPFESDWAALFTIADGYVLSEHVFFDRGKALRAAGLAK